MTAEEAVDAASKLTNSYQLAVYGKGTEDIISASDFGLALTTESVFVDGKLRNQKFRLPSKRLYIQS